MSGVGHETPGFEEISCFYGEKVYNFTNDVECMPSDAPLECRCEYASKVVDCMSTSRIPYMELEYCSFEGIPVLATFVCMIWLMFLFVNLALVVDARVVPNVTTIAKLMRMSDGLAGLTLLAFGNGVVDIFSAGAAVMASEDGGTLGVSVLLGCGLYVTLVVSGTISYLFEPDVQPRVLGRDAGFYLIGLCWMAYVLYDHTIELWEVIMFPSVYVIYVIFAIIMERFDKSGQSVIGFLLCRPWKEEKKQHLKGEMVPLISDTTAGATPFIFTTAYDDDVCHEGVHPGIIQSLQRYTRLKEAALRHPRSSGSLYDTYTRLDIFDTHEGAPWAEKSRLTKIVVMFQVPMRVLVAISTPVVFHEDSNIAWDRRLHVIIAFCSPAVLVAVAMEDAFYWEFSAKEPLPTMVIALCVGLALALIVQTTSVASKAPKYNNVFAVLGFTVSLFFIYAISEEVVSVIRSFGIMWQIPTSLVAMVILGAGNGTCDLVSNYLIASQGRPQIAIGAIYGAPCLNLYMGLTCMGVVAMIKYGLPFKIKSDAQIYIGLGFIMVALIVALGSSFAGKLKKKHAKFFLFTYAMFLVGSVLLLVVGAPIAT
eukprot:m.133217 g.133217  ORF g.133217 m.133217 type:complete len:594 (+) comp29662_c0_seq2:330-2111(+)